ncbi:unnamed protein product [Medioppia subpectinata]|uniref:Uncharacterized protein n=1 Tax=Medioppia subpectinata TaxID=1979941 RepID=A0A7R9L6V3_9ACAR|nr:unnamed protein product [Medioppia subpectinata]CAG2116515.1 unnamed protein product [Medioppia subpectinata]
MYLLLLFACCLITIDASLEGKVLPPKAVCMDLRNGVRKNGGIEMFAEANGVVLESALQLYKDCVLYDEGFRYKRLMKVLSYNE